MAPAAVHASRMSSRITRDLDVAKVVAQLLGRGKLRCGASLMPRRDSRRRSSSRQGVSWRSWAKASELGRVPRRLRAGRSPDGLSGRWRWATSTRTAPGLVAAYDKSADSEGMTPEDRISRSRSSSAFESRNRPRAWHDRQSSDRLPRRLAPAMPEVADVPLTGATHASGRNGRLDLGRRAARAMTSSGSAASRMAASQARTPPRQMQALALRVLSSPRAAPTRRTPRP